MKQAVCFAAVFALLFGGYALAERTVYANQGDICVYEENDLFGLMDDAENILLPAEYDWIYYFGDEAYIPLLQNGKQGYARRDGSIAVECTYESIYVCENTHLAHAFIPGNKDISELLIDLETGKVLMDEPLHNYAADENYIYDLSVGTNDGWAVTGPFNLSVYDHDLNLLFELSGAQSAHPFASGFVVWWEEGFYSAVDLNGNAIIDKLDDYRITGGDLYYSRIGKNMFNEILKHVNLDRNRLNRGLQRYLGFDGPDADALTAFLKEPVISGVLHADGTQMEIYADGIQPRDASGLYRGEKNGLWGYVNKNGEWVIEPAYAFAFPFVDGAAVVQCEGGTYRLIDSSGKQFGDAEWQNGTAFDLPLIPIEGSDVRLLNRKGEYVGEIFRRSLPWTTSCYDTFAGHLLLADSESRVCVVDMEANVVARLDIHDFSAQNVGGAMWAKKTGKWGLIDVFGENPGQWIIEPGFDFEYVYRNEDADAPYFGTSADGTEGYFDMYGNRLLPPKPEDLYD